MEMKELKPLVGAQVIVWGTRTFQGFLISWLQFLWLGVKNAPSHIQRVYNGIWDISAEAGGVVLVERTDVLRKARRVKIVVHRKYRQSGMEQGFQKICDQHLKKRYDFYFYLNSILRIVVGFFPLVLVLLFMINPGFVSVLLLFLFYWPFRRFLLNKSRNFWACAEFSNSLDSEMGVKTGIEIKESFSPLYCYRISIVCSDFKTLYDSGWIGKQ